SLTLFNTSQSNFHRIGGGFFTGTGGQSGAPSGFVHCAINSLGWKSNASATELGFACNYCASLISLLPSPFNAATVLLPVKAVNYAPSGGRVIVANPKNVRFTRNDNLQAGEVITLGADKRKIYPMYRKNATLRNL